MLASRIVLSLALLLALPCAVSAQEVSGSGDELVSTGSRVRTLPTEADIAKAKAQSVNTQAKPAVSQDMMIARLNAAAPASDRAMPVAYAEPQPEEGKRQIHGGAGVSIGTGGYRSGYVYSLIPIGDTGTLGIAVSDTNFGKNYVPYGYGAYYPGYDYRPYGYGYGARGGRSQSLAISYTDDETRENGPSTPEGCAPGFREGDRYVEPLWVTQLHGQRTCTSTGIIIGNRP